MLEHLTTPKTKNGYRTIPLPPKVVEMLVAEKATQEYNKSVLKDSYKVYEYDYVIRKADGSIYNPNRIINKLTTEIGLPHCRVHDYRTIRTWTNKHNRTAIHTQVQYCQNGKYASLGKCNQFVMC